MSQYQRSQMENPRFSGTEMQFVLNRIKSLEVDNARLREVGNKLLAWIDSNAGFEYGFSYDDLEALKEKAREALSGGK